MESTFYVPQNVVAPTFKNTFWFSLGLVVNADDVGQLHIDNKHWIFWIGDGQISSVSLSAKKNDLIFYIK